MDINPLISDLIKYKDELIDTIDNAIYYKELKKSDEYVCHSIAEIKGEYHSDTPFQQVADLYRLPLEEVVKNIRDFTNKTYKTEIMEGFINTDIDFDEF
jgi:hypothetical protein